MAPPSSGTHQIAKITPAKAPNPASSRLSTRSCRATRARVAPRARRTPISRRRRSPRTRSSPAASAQAMISTSDAAPKSSHEIRRACGRESGPKTKSDAATTFAIGSWRSSGCDAARRFAMTSSSACARSIGTPGFRRPTTSRKERFRPVSGWEAAKSGSAWSTIAIGTQTSGRLSRFTPMNRAGATPTTANGCPFSSTDRPTAAGSAPKRVRQRRSLITRTGCAPATRSSSGASSRPAWARVPRISK